MLQNSIHRTRPVLSAHNEQWSKSGKNVSFLAHFPFMIHFLFFLSISLLLSKQGPFQTVMDSTIKNSSGISARGEKTPLTGHLLCQGRIKTLDPRYHPLGGLSRENSKPCISSHSVKFHPVVDLQKVGQHLRACRSPWTRHETAGPCSGPGNGGWAREDHPTAGVGTAPRPGPGTGRSREHLRSWFVCLILLKLFFCRGRL